MKSTEPRLPYLGEQERAFEIYQSRAAFRAASLLASDGVPLTILVAGDPRRPTVLLVNALGVSCLFVANLAMRLAEEYHVVSWESRGLPDQRSLPADARLIDDAATPEEKADVVSSYRMIERIPVRQRVVWVLKHVEGETLADSSGSRH